MSKTKKFLIGSALMTSLAAISLPAVGQLRDRRSARGATGERQSFEFQGQTRAYRIHVPDSYDPTNKVPLVLTLHGGGGDAQVGSKIGMTPLADQHGFIAVYPEGINRHWNDGRNSEYFSEHDKKIDDVAFITELVKRLKSKYSIDPNRVFCLGASNGGFMTQRLAIERSETFSAVAILIASMAEPLKESFDPKRPVSVMFMNGTKDPLVPYDGGEVKVNLFPRLARFQQNKPSRGNCVATDDAVELWRKRNQLDGKESQTTDLPDSDPTDGSTVHLKLWSGGSQGTAVALYRVEGGGHTLPGAAQYMPESVVGTTNRDINAMETVWKFFIEYNREPGG
tara:strand:- start:261469 stop:262485 length:1017 start_codon:yes stop_codon:yes gene_type:complete